MTESLIGLRSIELCVTQPELDVVGFGSDQRAVVFFSNSALTTGHYTFNANELFGEYTHIWARKMHVDTVGSTDGSSTPWMEVLTGPNISNDGSISFDLDSNDIVEVKVTVGNIGISMNGGQRDDRMSGSDFNDSIFGGAGADQILGGDGNDEMSGEDGADTLAGGGGSDSLDGGDGFDFVDYSGSARGVRVDLQFSHVNSFDAAGDTFEFVEGVLGGRFDDDLRGDIAANSILGGDGKDFLRGRGGEDTLFGGEGNDVIWGGVRADRISGGSGRDRAQYSEATSGVLVDIAFSILNTGEAVGDTYESIEDIFGSSYNDRLRGDANNNIIWGGAGIDFLQGREGNDALYGGMGADTFFFAKNWGSQVPSASMNPRRSPDPWAKPLLMAAP
jgi:Ca2+-binding RTX toxin-like protein